jgi:hypothetical protein
LLHLHVLRNPILLHLPLAQLPAGKQDQKIKAQSFVKTCKIIATSLEAINSDYPTELQRKLK